MSRFYVGFEFEFYSKLRQNEVIYMLRSLVRKHRIPAKITTDDEGSYKGKFVVKDDCSIVPPDGNMPWMGYETYEVVTPPMRLSEAIPFMDDMFKWIDLFGSTNYSCGLHVNISFESGKKQERLEPWKVVLAYDDTEVLKNLRRRCNTYCRSLRKRIAPFVYKRADLNDVTSIINAIERYVDIYYKEKYMSVNVSRLDEGYVEFRALGGKDYQKRGEFVRDEINKMVKALEVALEPTHSEKITSLIGELLHDTRKEAEAARTRREGTRERGRVRQVQRRNSTSVRNVSEQHARTGSA